MDRRTDRLMDRLTDKLTDDTDLSGWGHKKKDTSCTVLCILRFHYNDTIIHSWFVSFLQLPWYANGLYLTNLPWNTCFVSHHHSICHDTPLVRTLPICQDTPALLYLTISSAMIHPWLSGICCPVTQSYMNFTPCRNWWNLLPPHYFIILQATIYGDVVICRLILHNVKTLIFHWDPFLWLLWVWRNHNQLSRILFHYL